MTLRVALKRGPEGLTSPLYGIFQTGPEKASLSHPVIAIAQDNVPTKLFVDANADGEITKDEAFDWTGKEFEKPDGAKVTNYFSEATVKLNREGKRGLVKFYYPIPTADTPGSGQEPQVYGLFHGLWRSGRNQDRRTDAECRA